MPIDLTIRDVPERVIDVLRQRADDDQTSIEAAAVVLLCAAIDSNQVEHPKVDIAWARTVEERVDAAGRGEAEMLDGERVFREIEAEMGGNSAGRDEDAA